MFAPCFMLCEDPLLSRIENMFFLDVESEMAFFVIFHFDSEISNKKHYTWKYPWLTLQGILEYLLLQ